ncbi:ABC transporter ATP-binding protein [Duganella sp. Leaf126]|uniref:ABC transporter ATP-binding protein n=1 Tax=Duganella sp. Leaf126 TaxID=1736266 RepID=UPI0006FC2365|nr:ABC transporter ATP-binding protein [Duganella sp. Leaf126]KQQ36294.1 ABC transporter ATP-binding protein [Duganella sp. Leaf126]
MLRVEQVYKSYGARQVLHSVSLTCAPGAYVLRGPNGVGKSTLLRVLAGVTPPDSGAIWIASHALQVEPVEARSRLAYVPDECPIYPFMTGSELLAFVAHAKRCQLTPQVRMVVERLDLARHLGTRCGDMSLGTQKKLMLAAAWIGEPSVLLLDEPSNGLDIDAQAVLVALLREKRDNAVVFVSSHDPAFAAGVGAQVLAFEALQGAPGSTG